MLVALLFNIEFQLLRLKNKIKDNNDEENFELNDLLLLSDILEKIGKITNQILLLLKKYKESHSEEEYLSYHSKIYLSKIEFDLSDYYKLIDNIGDDKLNKYDVSYKFQI